MLKRSLLTHDDQRSTDTTSVKSNAPMTISNALHSLTESWNMTGRTVDRKILHGEMRERSAGMTRAHLLCWFENCRLFFLFLILGSVPNPKNNYQTRSCLKCLLPQPTGMFDWPVTLPNGVWLYFLEFNSGTYCINY